MEVGIRPTIRTEEPSDYSVVFTVIEKSFANVEHSDHREQFLVERLRKSTAFVPELALVAEVDGEIIGYILLTKIQIKSERESTTSLALAPVAVLPTYQGKGVGGQLIEAAHERAKGLGFAAVVLLGHEDYYPRFGYKSAKAYGIELPFDVPDENCMAIELVEGALSKVNGVVEYPTAFNNY